MKRRIDRIKVFSLIIMTFFAFFVVSCSQPEKPETEDEFKEAFFQDKAIFEDVCDKALQYEWTDENVKKGIVVLRNPQIELGVNSEFLKKYRIEYVAIDSDTSQEESMYVSICMADAMDGYAYATFYYSLSGEPKSSELGEYQEDLGMYYYKEKVSQGCELFTERLDEHWFLWKGRYL